MGLVPSANRTGPSAARVRLARPVVRVVPSARVTACDQYALRLGCGRLACVCVQDRAGRWLRLECGPVGRYASARGTACLCACVCGCACGCVPLVPILELAAYFLGRNSYFRSGSTPVCPAAG